MSSLNNEDLSEAIRKAQAERKQLQGVAMSKKGAAYDDDMFVESTVRFAFGSFVCSFVRLFSLAFFVFVCRFSCPVRRRHTFVCRRCVSAQASKYNTSIDVSQHGEDDDVDDKPRRLTSQITAPKHVLDSLPTSETGIADPLADRSTSRRIADRESGYQVRRLRAGAALCVALSSCTDFGARRCC